MPAVVFDPAGFVARYPEFAAYNTANPGGLQQFFNEAGLYLSNTDCPVQSLTRRAVYLNQLTAHIAVLNGVLNPPSQAGAVNVPVGRVSDATEGSVSASLEYKAPASATEAWANQTQYGAAWWVAMLPYRSFRYRPRVTVVR